MKVLITGGAGFLGSNIARELLNQGHQVTIVDDLSGGFESNIPEGAMFLKGDIVDSEFIDKLFEISEFDYIYHAAAYAAEGLSHWIRVFNYTNNLIGSINLINASIKNKIKCFIFTSSMAVYGTQQVPYNEEQKPQPEDPYGIAKYSIEQDLAAAYKMFDLNYIIFRPHNIYGIHQNIGDKYRNVIGIFMNQAMKGENITVFGDGEQTRAFSYVDDMTPIMALAYDKETMYQQIYNIGGDVPYTINQLAETVVYEMGSKSKIIHLNERYEVKDAYSSHDKIRHHFALGQTSLRTGIKEMAKWAKEVGPQQSKNMDLELTKNLYEAFK
jgi:UDP-glucose 4-epimerase